MKYKIKKTTYPIPFGKYGDMEDRIDELKKDREKNRLCKCIVCNFPFDRNDDVYLAVIKGQRNKFVCGNCAARL